MDGWEIQEVLGQLNLLELAAEIALLKPKILNRKRASDRQKPGQSLCVGPSWVKGAHPATGKTVGPKKAFQI